MKKFDGIKNFKTDDQVETLLNKHLQKYKISSIEGIKNFQIYARRIALKKYIAHYELFRQIKDLPGDIVELGVFKGRSLMTWANFLEILNMGDRQKQVFGFDNFAGFKNFSKKDGPTNKKLGKVKGGFNSSDNELCLLEAIKIFDKDRFIPYKPRVKLIKGDIEKTLPIFLENNPGLRISLLHFDCDLYKPTLTALDHLWPLVVRGGVLIFDEYAIRPWQGESEAVDEFFAKNNLKPIIKKFDWSPTPGGFLFKN